MDNDKIFVGIDPGMNGGITFLEKEQDLVSIKAQRCPKTAEEMAVLFSAGIKGYAPEDVVLFIEHVWSFPGDGKVSAFKFGYNYGLWKGIAASHEVQIVDSAPRKWMAHYELPPKMESRERKRWLRELAEKLYPNIKITFNTSDSVLIAHYGMECYNSNSIPVQEGGFGLIK